MKRILFILLCSTLWTVSAQALRLGAERTESYLPLLQGKRVGLVVNQSSMVGRTHLIDTLQHLGINITVLFSPEHGVRGKSEAGAKVASGTDVQSGLPVISLYGKNKKPTPEQIRKTDVVVFDLQDVGARFYTYISTMHYVMQTCAETNTPFIVLDRPNPNGFLVDGPLLDTTRFRTFVGMHPVPIAHGMTVGEYAQMLNGEQWLGNNLSCPLTIILMEGYTHQTHYTLPIAPSPNLSSMESIYLYPTLCLFEGTTLSLGRGTSKPFTQVGHPLLKQYKHTFTPHDIVGVSTNPPHKDKHCYGIDFSNTSTALGKDSLLHIEWIIDFYNAMPKGEKFFVPFFDKLAGSDMRSQIEARLSADEIRQSWQNDLNHFKAIRKKYLLYPETNTYHE